MVNTSRTITEGSRKTLKDINIWLTPDEALKLQTSVPTSKTKIILLFSFSVWKRKLKIFNPTWFFPQLHKVTEISLTFVLRNENQNIKPNDNTKQHFLQKFQICEFRKSLLANLRIWEFEKLFSSFFFIWKYRKSEID